MNRDRFQTLADIRIEDSESLLAAGRWSAAYYLAGYAVECGLKACIAKLTNQYDFPDKEFAVKCYTHNIEALVKWAGLMADRDEAMTKDPLLRNNWLIVKDWDESARYKEWAEAEARAFVSAVADVNHGVMPWIQGRW